MHFLQHLALKYILTGTVIGVIYFWPSFRYVARASECRYEQVKRNWHEPFTDVAIIIHLPTIYLTILIINKCDQLLEMQPEHATNCYS